MHFGFKDLLKDNRGVTAIEYAFICGLIVVVIVGGITLLGNSVSNSYTNTASQVTNAVGAH